MLLEPPPYLQMHTDVAEVRYLSRTTSTETIAGLPPSSRNTPKEEKPIYVSEIQSRDLFQSLPIISMTIPRGRWLLEKLPSGLPNAYNIWLKKDSSITINFGSGGVLEGANSQFKKIISREPSQLTSAEIAYFYPSGSFVAGHTEELNGKRVIVFEGHFKEKNLDIYQLEFNHNPDMSGVCVQAVITFSAPPSQYKQHIKAFKAALKTILWIHKVEIDPSKG
ncbi:hypothetical protein KBI23_13030 [bacterium]|nr:hypothetical protein [bacterium]MBP9810258.1 hypothetical protein [bacterium]